MSMNIYSLNGIGTFCTIDAEYNRIVRELRAFGIEPTGDKNIDKAKLQEVKASKNTVDGCNIQIISEIKASGKIQAQSSEENLKNDTSIQTQNIKGAEQIAALNKYKLLGHI